MSVPRYGWPLRLAVWTLSSAVGLIAGKLHWAEHVEVSEMLRLGGVSLAFLPGLCWLATLGFVDRPRQIGWLYPGAVVYVWAMLCWMVAAARA